MLTFRIDDVSLNTDGEKLIEITQFLQKEYSGCKIIWGISLTMCCMGEAELIKERIFPRKWNALSDHKKFYEMEMIGRPRITLPGVEIASHGIVHVDHRFLSKDAQEMSIITSCSILSTKVFIPPFNKWNQDTLDICMEKEIILVMFEHGWKHLKYETFEPEGRYYFHTHDFTFEDFKTYL